jgi:hypothetical protein
MRTRNLFMQESTERGEVRLARIAGVDNPADALTKPLSRPQWLRANSLLKIEGSVAKA